MTRESAHRVKALPSLAPCVGFGRRWAHACRTPREITNASVDYRDVSDSGDRSRTRSMWCSSVMPAAALRVSQRDRRHGTGRHDWVREGTVAISPMSRWIRRTRARRRIVRQKSVGADGGRRALAAIMLRHYRPTKPYRCDDPIAIPKLPPSRTLAACGRDDSDEFDNVAYMQIARTTISAAHPAQTCRDDRQSRRLEQPRPESPPLRHGAICRFEKYRIGISTRPS